MGNDFETDVIEKLDQILEQLAEIKEWQEQLEEGLRNISTPGGGFGIFDTE